MLDVALVAYALVTAIVGVIVFRNNWKTFGTIILVLAGLVAYLAMLRWPPG